MTLSHSTSIITDNLVLCLDAGNLQKSFGPNLVTVPTVYTANQNVTITDDGGFKKVVSNQTTSTPGTWRIGNAISVLQNTTYVFEITGRRDNTSTMPYLYVRNEIDSTSISFSVLLSSTSNQKHSVTFNTGTATSISVGVLFSSPQIGHTFWVKDAIVRNISSWIDLSSYKFDSTPSGSQVFNVSNNGSITFNGSSTQVSIPISSSFNTNSVTVEAWVKLNSDASRHIILANWQGYALEVDSAGLLSMETYSSGGQNQVRALASSALSWGTWSHLVGTYNSDTAESRCYLNGQLVGTRASTNSIVYGVSTHKISPSDFAGGYVNGEVAILRQYSRALSNAEIIQNYNALRGRFGI